MTEELKRTTPGPWIVGVCTIKNSTEKRRMIGVMPAKDTSKVTALCGYEGAQDEAESIANAALIATAPDMFDALIAIQETLMTSKETIDLEAINVMISGVFERLANEAGEVG